MAIRARLSAPRQERNDWPWHQAKWTSLSASLLMGGDRRMEAENYLAGGYGVRLAMETRKTGWTRLADMAHVWQPSRLKGIQVSPEFGTPFLAATQVFDLRPVPRKFLSVDRIPDADALFVKNGQILVTRSGSVGRATLAHRPHENTLISDDLLRVEPRKPEAWGWLYAYLRSPQARAMMSAAQYGHMIKHLEVSHLNALPVPWVREVLASKFQVDVKKVLDHRSRAFELTTQAESEYAACFPSLRAGDNNEVGYIVPASDVFNRRRRLDGACHIPTIKRINSAHQHHDIEVAPLSTVTDKIFVPNRFKHIYGDGGTPYLDSADLLEVNPDIKKYVLSLTQEEQGAYLVKPNWILIPCSGQVYGNIGHAVLSTEWHTGKILSNHILRICPNKRVRSGYLQCVLGHHQLGRPQVVRFAFGSSVPEINAEDIATVPIPRLPPDIENHLADMMEEAAKCRDAADELEQFIAADAEVLIDRFLAGDTQNFILSGK